MKSVVLTVLMCLLLLPLNAQLGLSAGAGITISDLRGQIEVGGDEILSSAFTSWMIYARPELGVFEHISVAADVQIANQGFINKNDGSGQQLEARRFNFIEVLPQVEFRPFSFMGVAAGAGVSVRIREADKINGAWVDAKDKLSNSANLTYFAGARFYPFSNFTFHVTAGLTKLADTGSLTGKSLKAGNIQIGVGYKIF
ncbi:MAG: outer membrane beta-barrel protein [Saprospiraceae bacterium]|nr:MAG: hypothetical protein UZ09_BCD002001935 [Bacteroidetes bacterium OLB9]MCO6464815.1 outer membrane beta-barrel protein [Saprospiraceae bacterium]